MKLLPVPVAPVMRTLLVLVDPAAGGELADDGLVELAPGGVVDGLDAGLREFELGLLQGAGEALVLAGEPLGVDEQAEALVEGEGGQLGAAAVARSRPCAMASSLRAWSLSRVGVVSIGPPSLVVVPAAEVLVDGSEGERRDAARAAAGGRGRA